MRVLSIQKLPGLEFAVMRLFLLQQLPGCRQRLTRRGLAGCGGFARRCRRLFCLVLARHRLFRCLGGSDLLRRSLLDRRLRQRLLGSGGFAYRSFLYRRLRNGFLDSLLCRSFLCRSFPGDWFRRRPRFGQRALFCSSLLGNSLLGRCLFRRGLLCSSLLCGGFAGCGLAGRRLAGAAGFLCSLTGSHRSRSPCVQSVVLRAIR